MNMSSTSTNSAANTTNTTDLLEQQPLQRTAVMQYYPPSPHLIAQKLNNCAALSLQIGNYDEGIHLLTRALKITEQDNSTYITSCCHCNACSLESCLLMTPEFQEAAASALQAPQDSQQGPQVLARQQLLSSSLSSLSSSHDDTLGGFVYKRPLLVHKTCIEEEHYMGITLSLIILFNLALAHHLKAIVMLRHPTTTTMAANSTTGYMKVLQKALQLYELSYQLHVEYIQQSQQQHDDSEDMKMTMAAASPMNDGNEDNDNDTTTSDDAMMITSDEDDDDHHHAQQVAYDDEELPAAAATRTASSSSSSTGSSIGSLRMTMIVSNNLGEIHRIAGNAQKHTLCLEHLVSAIMYTVDCNLIDQVVVDKEELDGFFKNVTPVMVGRHGDICAKAA